MEETPSILSHSQRYAAAALFALAVNQSQIHQGRTPVTPRGGGGDAPGIADPASVSDKPDLWIHENSGLLWPVFRFLGVDDQTWHGLKEIAGSSSQVRHHLGAFLKLLSEEGDATSKERLDQEAALTNAVDATEMSMNSTTDSSYRKCGGHEQKTRSQGDLCDIGLNSSVVAAEPHGETKESSALLPLEKQASTALENAAYEQPLEEATLVSYQRKVTVLYTLLSACVADTAEVDKKCSKSRQGYDARHRVSLRLLAVWLGVKWNEMVCVHGTCACISNTIWKQWSLWLLFL